MDNELAPSETSLGQSRVESGRRQVQRIPGLPADIAAPPIASVAVVGAGQMGTGIGIALLAAGLRVLLIEPREETRAKAAATIAATFRRDVEKGRISSDVAETRIAALTLADAVETASDADLILEAVFEDLAVKQSLFRTIDAVAKPGAILASNTSTLDLDQIAAVTGRPEQVVGLHFFSPAHIMKLVEVVRGAKTAPQVLASAMALTQTLGKVGVVSGVCNGFIGNRMFEECLRQAYFLLEEGALPAQIDSALEQWGMAMGPLKVMDLAGQDIGWSIRNQRRIEQPDRPYSAIPDQLYAMGRYGQKTGAGYYLYPDGRTAQVDPEIETMIETFSADHGIERRAISDEEIVERCIFALANEGFRIVGEGVAYRPVDVDMIWVFGYGFPAARGGPMFYADRVGLTQVLKRIKQFEAGRNGWAWTPAPLLVDLTQSSKPLSSLDQP